MQLEALQQAGADRCERTPARTAYRYRTRDRTLVTRYGDVVPLKTRFEEKPLETQILEMYARVEKALVKAIPASYLGGSSTRKVLAIISPLGINQLSPSPISRLALDLEKWSMNSSFVPSINNSLPSFSTYHTTLSGMSRRRFSRLPASGTMGIASSLKLLSPTAILKRSGPASPLLSRNDGCREYSWPFRCWVVRGAWQPWPQPASGRPGRCVRSTHPELS